MKLLNALSLNMIPADGTLKITTISAAQAATMLRAHGMESSVGHDPAAISHALGLPVEQARLNVILEPSEQAIVAQYVGPRLPEGTTTLPPGAVIHFKLIQWTPSCTF